MGRTAWLRETGGWSEGSISSQPSSQLPGPEPCHISVLGMWAELATLLILCCWVLDLASPLTRSITLGLAFCFLNHSFSSEMGTIADETACFGVVTGVSSCKYMRLSPLREQGGDT
jgi:hypothetical protein